LLSTDEDSFVIDIDGTEQQITYADISSARTVFVWDKKRRTKTDA
jgi:ribosome maturation factor RimP